MIKKETILAALSIVFMILAMLIMMDPQIALIVCVALWLGVSFMSALICIKNKKGLLMRGRV